MVKALEGGTDYNCGCYFEKYLLPALNASKLDSQRLDLAAGRIINALLRTGQWLSRRRGRCVCVCFAPLRTLFRLPHNLAVRSR